MSERYDIRWTGTAKRALAEQLPENVVSAVLELILGPISESPYRVGKPIREPFDGMFSARRSTYRVLHTVDEDKRIVTIEVIRHLRDAYRT